jgi:hypothetical protein
LPNLKDLSLNVVLALVATAAVAMISIEVYEEFAGQAASVLKSRRFRDWRDYAAVRNRIGPPTVSVTVVEFSDFPSPFCQQARVDLREMRKQYRRVLQVVHLSLQKSSPCFQSLPALAAVLTPFTLVY